MSRQEEIEVIAALMSSESLLRETGAVVSAALFTDPGAGWVAEQAVSLWRTYDSLPTEGQLRARQGDAASHMVPLVSRAIGDVVTVKPPDPVWAGERIRVRAGCTRLLAADPERLAREGRFEEVLRVANEALLLSSPPGRVSQGAGTREEFRNRHDESTEALSVGVGPLDEDMGGGLGRKRFGHVVGEKGAGKSHVLTWLGVQGLGAGKCVLHVSLEMPEHECRARYDRCITGLDSRALLDAPDAVWEGLIERQRLLYVLEASDIPLTVASLENHIEKMDRRPDVLVVDYATLMRGSSHRGDVGQVERRTINEVALGLRRLGQKGEGMWTWTAYQVNRTGARKGAGGNEPLGKTDYALAYEASWHADVVLTINRSTTDLELGLGGLHLAENRGGPKGRTVRVDMDWSVSRLRERGLEGLGGNGVAGQEKSQQTASEDVTGG